MIIGTSHFISKEAAIKYYSDYEYDDVKSAVERKLQEGLIHIGPPQIQDKEYLKVNNEGRYLRIDKKG